MNISIEKFKSIRRLKDFEIKPFTVLSGVNSAGKSSFVQFLLLLKQTVELDSSSKPLLLNGYYYQVKDFKDIVFNKDLQNKLEISFQFNKSEISKIDFPELKLFDSYDDLTAQITIQFGYAHESIFINKFAVNLQTKQVKDQKIIFQYIEEEKHSITTNTDLYVSKIPWDEETQVKLRFLSLYPSYYELISKDKSEKSIVQIEWVQSLINKFFQKISYIGPNRDQPKEDYTFQEDHNQVGIYGEFVAQVLQEYANESISFYTIKKHDEGIIYNPQKNSLIAAVKYWMCDIFEVAHDIKAEKINDIYKIILINKSGLSTNIKHVGFGISQLLPIIVEGLRMKDDGILIVEQPEIHLHPKIQSLLFDFLYGLSMQGKTILIETHSSHFLTRMRRRIAENKNDDMLQRINLTFIENDIFKTLELDDCGILDYFPEDFIENSHHELRAIVKAQMKKKQN